MLETPYYAADSLSAAVYDPLEEATRPAAREIAFYRDLAAECATPVIELGIGTGRIAWPLAEAGRRVIGLDRSSAMLAQAEAKRNRYPPDVADRVRLVVGDMRDFDLGVAVDLLIIPHRAFNHLTGPADQRACLGAVRRHLGPRGRAVLDIAHPTFEYLVDDRIFEAGRRIVLRFADGVTIERLAESRVIDFEEQVLTLRMVYTLRAPDGRLLRETAEPFVLRWTNPHEMRHLLELCGLRAVAEHGGFDRSAPTGVGDRLWIVARADG